MNPQGLKPVWVPSEDNISISTVENESVDSKTEPVLEQISRSASFEELEEQEQCQKSWENLQTEVQDVHQLFEDFSHMVQVR